MEEQEKKDLDDCIAKVTRNATRWFIYLPRYFEIPGATLKSLPRLSGLLGELPGITTYSRVLSNSSDWSKRLLNMDEYFKAYTSHFDR